MKINVFLPKIAWFRLKAKLDLRRSKKTEHRRNLRTACIQYVKVSKAVVHTESPQDTIALAYDVPEIRTSKKILFFFFFYLAPCP